MLKRLKIFAVRNFYRAVNPIRRLYWYVVRPKTRGVKCVIEHESRLLLVRLNYAHRRWTFPGGRVKRGETFEDGVRREIKEELEIVLGKLEKIGEYQGRREYKRDTVQCFLGQVTSADFRIDELEIREAAWFKPDQMPVDRTSSADSIIRMYLDYYGN